jgi:hypothetical protein
LWSKPPPMGNYHGAISRRAAGPDLVERNFAAAARQMAERTV